MPPGMMMSPGFWSPLQAPSHFASMVVVVSRVRRPERSVLFEVDLDVKAELKSPMISARDLPTCRRSRRRYR